MHLMQIVHVASKRASVHLLSSSVFKPTQQNSAQYMKKVKDMPTVLPLGLTLQVLLSCTCHFGFNGIDNPFEERHIFSFVTNHLCTPSTQLFWQKPDGHKSPDHNQQSICNCCLSGVQHAAQLCRGSYCCRLTLRAETASHYRRLIWRPELPQAWEFCHKKWPGKP